MIIKKESEFKNWFRKNYRKFGFSKIVRDDIGECPDFIMLRDKKEVGVELETLASNFELHSHHKDEIDEIICIVNNRDLNIPTTEAKGLEFQGKERTSFTVDKGTVKIIDSLVKTGKYRNRSHAVEVAIELLKKEMEKSKW